MKKQNTFKRSEIKYEPIKQPKQPLWMHSIDRPTTNNDSDAIKSFAFLIGITALIFILLFIWYGN